MVLPEEGLLFRHFLTSLHGVFIWLMHSHRLASFLQAHFCEEARGEFTAEALWLWGLWVLYPFFH